MALLSVRAASSSEDHIGEVILRMQGPRGVSDELDEEKDQDAQLRALLEAMGDPLRSRLLFAVDDRRATGVSVRELAEELGESSRRVRYHLDALAAQGLIAIAEERPRRGVVERYYRTERKPRISSEEMDLVEKDQGRRISMQILKAILADASAAAAAGTFGGRADEATVRIRGRVDREGWQELYATHTTALGNLETIIAKAEARLTESNESPIAAVSALLLFEMPT
jgi:DNA-binding transcriptional ArsR family regulator